MPSSERSGKSITLLGSFGTLRLHPLGLTLSPETDGPTLATASTMIARTVEPRMPSRIAPLTFRTTRTRVSSRPRTKTADGQLTSLPPIPRLTGGDEALPRTKPASTKPINARNRPMPTPVAVFNWVGTERKIAVRSPVSTRTVMTRPSMTTRPIASAQVIFGATS